MLLELCWVLDVDIRMLYVCGDELELRVELGDAILREQPQQVEAEDGVLALRLGQRGRAVGVVDLELRHVPLEGGDLHRLHREQRAVLEDLARQQHLALLRLVGRLSG